MRNQKGVTMLSLTVYIIVSVVVLGTLAFLNVNFMSQIADLTVKSTKSGEVLKVQAFLIDDIKASERVLEFSDRYLRLSNGAEYTVKFSSDERNDDNQTFNIYELYRNNVLITDELSNVEFGFDNAENQEIVKVRLSYTKDENFYTSDYNIKVGKGY